MADTAEMIEAFDARAKRRDFFKSVVGAAVVGAGGFAFASVAQAQAGPTDNDILNFALNLEYLEAQFYSFAFFGRGLDNADLTGSVGTRGDVVGGRQVTFADPIVRQYAREIAQDEIAHVKFLRSALGTAAVAQPAIDIRGGAGGPFAAAAVAAGVPGGASFDPYADDNSFLLGAYIFEDVGVTAYKGASPLITNNAFLDAAAGILAVEAFHAGIVRGSLYARGVNTPALRTNADLISNARDSLDGTTGTTADLDQGISPVQTAITTSAGTTTAAASNFVPTDANGIAFSRTTGQVLNIVYLTRAAATAGGFFPTGVNGTIRSSAAN
ncbi:ferritin-like domain-containing protein [uncultured Sphingomonas sp.]|uniref:ferritin-like domain-containing protein n=1 Tax=uncultured Sphingomonas sp. TaxID=158754 RepID=UPI0035CBF4BE